LEVSNRHELFVFFGTVAGGLTVGLLLDMFRLLRRNVHPGRIGLWVQDILFWLLLTAIVYTTVFLTNSAELRWYEFVGLGLGLTLYLLLLSRPVMTACDFILQMLRRIVTFLIKIILFPVALVYRITRRPVRFIYAKINNSKKRIFRIGKRIGRRTGKKILQIKRVFRKV